MDGEYRRLQKKGGWCACVSGYYTILLTSLVVLFDDMYVIQLKVLKREAIGGGQRSLFEKADSPPPITGFDSKGFAVGVGCIGEEVWEIGIRGDDGGNWEVAGVDDGRMGMGEQELGMNRGGYGMGFFLSYLPGYGCYTGVHPRSHSGMHRLS